MTNEKNMVKVTNRGTWTVGYSIPEMGVQRRFIAHESKMISTEELRKLAWIDGGRAIINNHLIIEDEALVKEIFNEVEPEYFYTEEDVIKLLTLGSEDALRDALDFAPEGVIGLIKDIAVKIKLNDVRKRDIILETTGFNVTNAIRVLEESEVVETVTKTRRVNAEAVAEEETPVAAAPTARRTSLPKYNVTSIK